MPYYDYKCDKCNHEEEKLEPITAPEVQECPHCKETTLKRILKAASSFVLSGGGWYKQGYTK